MILDSNGNRRFYLNFDDNKDYPFNMKDVIIKDDSFDAPKTEIERLNKNLNLHPAGGICAWLMKDRFMENRIYFPGNPTWEQFSFPETTDMWSFGKPHILYGPSDTGDYIYLYPDLYSMYFTNEQGKHTRIEYNYVINNTLPKLEDTLFSKPYSFTFANSSWGSRTDLYVGNRFGTCSLNRVVLSKNYMRDTTHLDNKADGFLHFNTRNDDEFRAVIFGDNDFGKSIEISQWAIIACHNCNVYDIANIYLYDANSNTKSYSNALPEVAGLRMKRSGMSLPQKGYYVPLEGANYTSYPDGTYANYSTTSVRNLNIKCSDGEFEYDTFLVETRGLTFDIGNTLITSKRQMLTLNGISQPLYMASINDYTKPSAARVITECFEFNDRTYLTDENYETNTTFFTYNPNTLPQGYETFGWNKR